METKGMVAAGRAGMVYKGIYSESKSYSRLDAVSYQNSIYIAKKDSAGILPTDTEHWILSITGQTGTAESVAYDGTESGLTADNVQAAIDELSQKGGSTGTVNYNELENRPAVNGVTLEGDKTLSELGIQPKGNYAPVNSPVFTGTPKAPTPEETENSTRIATTAYVKTLISNLINGAPETLDTLKEIADALGESDDAVQALNAAIENKVDKVSGKGLSTNDFTTVEKNKLSGIATGAEVNVQSDWGVTDTNSDAFIKNKPTIPSVGNGTITIKQAGVSKGTFTTNQSGNITIELTDNNTTYSNFVKSGSGAKNGLVPAPSTTAGTSKYLREDGTWQTPPKNSVSLTNNLLASTAGTALDAVQGKVLDDKISVLNDNLMFPDGTRFYPDKQDDNYGFNTDAARGADTFRPFKPSDYVKFYGYFTSGVYTINLDDNNFFCIIDTPVTGCHKYITKEGNGRLFDHGNAYINYTLDNKVLTLNNVNVDCYIYGYAEGIYPPNNSTGDYNN